MRRLVPWALLGLSLCLNAALLLRGAPTRAPGGEVIAASPPAGAAAPPAADLRPHAAPGASAPRLPGPPADCETARAAALQGEAERLERELLAALHPSQRFERSTGWPGAEARVLADLRRVLDAAGVSSWSVACRGDTCRLEILSGRDDRAWQMSLQQDEALRGWLRGMQFRAGAPRTDPLSGETYDEEEIYFDVRPEPNRLPGELRRLVAAFKLSRALAECTGAYAEKGTFEARIQIGPAGLAILAAGSLAVRPAGRCLEERLRAALESLAGERPLEGDGVVVFLRMSSPPEP